MTLRHLLIISLLVLCVGISPVWAQEPPANPPENPPANPPAEPPAPNPVETFLQAAITFGDTLGEVAGFDKSAYVKAVEDIQKSVATLPTSDSGYVAADYFKVVGESVAAMADQITKSSHPYKSYIQGEYTNTVAAYIKNDCDSIVNGFTTTAEAYTKAYENVNTMYSTRLATQVGGSTQTNMAYNVENYYDAGAPNPLSRGPIRVSIDTAGIYDKWLGYTVRNMVTALKDKFSYDTQLQEDLNWFLKVWPQSTELDVTTAQANGSIKRTPDDTTYNAGSGREVKAINASYTLNDFGKPSDEVLPEVLKNYPLADQVYLDRQYGYNTTTKTGYGYTGYSSWQVASYHIFNTVSIQVGDRNYQLYDSLAVSPIVLDLDGDATLEASKGEYLPHPYNGAKLVEFDINGDEFLELTEWVGSHDGILLQYNNERELNANALFGEAGGFSDGYEKLSLLDANNDKQLTGDELKTLSVWQDQNTNGKVDTGEISSVTTLGITAISLAHQDLVSSFTQNGTSKKMWDWYPVAFRVKRTR